MDEQTVTADWLMGGGVCDIYTYLLGIMSGKVCRFSSTRHIQPLTASMTMSGWKMIQLEEHISNDLVAANALGRLGTKWDFGLSCLSGNGAISGCW